MSYFQKRLRGYLGGRRQWVGNPSRHFACRENRANLLRRGRMVSLHATLYTLVSHNIHAQKIYCATYLYSFTSTPLSKKLTQNAAHTLRGVLLLISCLSLLLRYFPYPSRSRTISRAWCLLFRTDSGHRPCCRRLP